MANRYWVGGTNTWNATAGSKWSATSGGASGASAPTISDDVFFDANSGAAVVQVPGVGGPAVAFSKNLAFTGFTGTLEGAGTLECAGSLTLVSGMTHTHTNKLFSSASSATITSAGKLLGSLTFNGAGTWTLQDSFQASAMTLTQGIFDANNFSVAVSGTFTLGPGVEFRSGTSSVSTFSGAVIANGTAGSPISISGLVRKTSGTVLTYFCTITSSTADGGARWLAPLSAGNVNGGSNSGWIFDNIGLGQQTIEVINAA